MNCYKTLNKQEFQYKDYSLVPIRFDDRFLIMKWRNEQIYHLRQNSPLTEEQQDFYFNKVVSQLYNNNQPGQLLFSFLHKSVCIGYGGLVHINWLDKHAELSFIMDTQLEPLSFVELWCVYLKLIEEVAFNELGFHKIFTYAYDLRPQLYKALNKSNFKKEATLRDHCFFEGRFIDVIIHSKIDSFKLRKANQSDLETTFNWANSPITRRYSFHKEQINKESHTTWFTEKINNPKVIYLILENIINTPLGSIRLDFNEDTAIISYLISPLYQGRGLGNVIVCLAEEYIRNNKIPVQKLIGFVFKENLASIKIFEKLNYTRNDQDEQLKYEKFIP